MKDTDCEPIIGVRHLNHEQLLCLAIFADTYTRRRIDDELDRRSGRAVAYLSTSQAQSHPLAVLRATEPVAVSAQLNHPN